MVNILGKLKQRKTHGAAMKLLEQKQWVNNQDRQRCVICVRKFTPFVRKHHCRACGEVICSRCIQNCVVQIDARDNELKATKLCMDCIVKMNDVHSTEPESSTRDSRLDDETPTTPTRREDYSISIEQVVDGLNVTDIEQEAIRLKVLESYGILDSAADIEFDAICQLAAAAMSCTVAAIGFIDKGRQWYKASVGIAQTQLPREVAFCEQLLKWNSTEQNTSQKPALVILDASVDPRFMDNPLVSGAAHIRFYAGAPIINKDGFVLGSILVLDVERRHGVPSRLVEILGHLAALAMKLLEDRKNGIKSCVNTLLQETALIKNELFKSALPSIEESTNERSTLSPTVSAIDAWRESNTFINPIAYQIPVETPNLPAMSIKNTLPQKTGSNQVRTEELREIELNAGKLGNNVGSHKESNISTISQMSQVIELHDEKYRRKLLNAISKTASPSMDSMCLDLLCRVTDTQQLLAKQQGNMLERLNDHSDRIHNIETCVEKMATSLDRIESVQREYMQQHQKFIAT